MKKIAVFLFLAGASVFYAQDASKMFYQDVSWSPDGKYIAATGLHDYVKETDAFQTDIYVMRSDGSALTKITGDAKNEYYTSLSKRRVVFSAKTAGTKSADLFTANYDGTDVKQVTKDAGNNSTPAFSPNGKLIAFTSNRDAAKAQIYVMDADGSHVRRVTNDATIGYYNPQWSRDGRWLVYYTEMGDSKDQVWIMRADGTEQTLLTANIGHNIFPGWTRDGNIVFSSSKRDTAGDGSYVTGSFLYTIGTDGKGLKKLANIQSFFARTSPDGKKVAFIKGGFPQSSIYVANADGSGAVKITN